MGLKKKRMRMRMRMRVRGGDGYESGEGEEPGLFAVERISKSKQFWRVGKRKKLTHSDDTTQGVE